jgi:hypothetical protein
MRGAVTTLLVLMLAGCGGTARRAPVSASDVQRAIRGQHLATPALGKVTAAHCSDEGSQWSCEVTTTTGRTNCTVGIDADGQVAGTYCGSLHLLAAERRRRACARLKRIAERVLGRKHLDAKNSEFNSGSTCITVPVSRNAGRAHQVVTITGHSSSPQQVRVSRSPGTLRLRSSDGRRHALLLPVDNGLRVTVPARGIADFRFSLKRGSYPFVIDGVQGPHTLVLLVEH